VGRRQFCFGRGPSRLSRPLQPAPEPHRRSPGAGPRPRGRRGGRGGAWSACTSGRRGGAVGLAGVAPAGAQSNDARWRVGRGRAGGRGAVTDGGEREEWRAPAGTSSGVRRTPLPSPLPPWTPCAPSSPSPASARPSTRPRRRPSSRSEGGGRRARGGPRVAARPCPRAAPRVGYASRVRPRRHLCASARPTDRAPGAAPRVSRRRARRSDARPPLPPPGHGLLPAVRRADVRGAGERG